MKRGSLCRDAPMGVSESPVEGAGAEGGRQPYSAVGGAGLRFSAPCNPGPLIHCGPASPPRPARRRCSSTPGPTACSLCRCSLATSLEPSHLLQAPPTPAAHPTAPSNPQLPPRLPPPLLLRTPVLLSSFPSLPQAVRGTSLLSLLGYVLRLSIESVRQCCPVGLWGGL